MKKILLIYIVLQLAAALLFADNRLRLLRIQPEEGSKAKANLLFQLTDLETILKDPEVNLSEGEINLRLYNPEGREIAQLGTIKKGKVKWLFKKKDDAYLRVKMDPPHVEALLAESIQKNPKTKYRLRLVNKKRTQAGELDIIKSYKLCFFPHLDVYGILEYPVNAAPGEVLGQRVKVTLYNEGIVAAKDFCVELVLSADKELPLKPGTYNEHFSEDVLLKDGRLTVEKLEPGESVTLTFGDALMIPGDTPPGNYHLGAVLDPENKLDELDEENNRLARFIGISPPAPREFSLELTDTRLNYRPADFEMDITAYGAVLTNGHDWRKCRIKNNIHQLKQVGWQGSFWELNSAQLWTWKVSGVDFCKKGGASKKMRVKMKVKGGSKGSLPSSVMLLLPGTILTYRPGDGALRLQYAGAGISAAASWKVIKVGPQVYHIRYGIWKDFFWEVDTYRKYVRKITGGSFGQPSGSAETLNIPVSVIQ